MTEQDTRAAVELAQDTINGKLEMSRESLKKQWGRGEKRTAREQQALIFASRLVQIGGTFLLTQEMRDFGYDNIWQAFAGELHEQGAKPMQKAANAEAHADMYRQGCYALNRQLMEEWNDAMILLVPRTFNGALVAVITINPDLVVNENGQTAFDVWEKREMNRAEGQVRASAKKLTRATNPAVAQATLEKIVAQLPEFVRLPNGTREQDDVFA